MKRLVSLIGLVALLFALGGCAVVPVGPVYGPPIGPVYGPPIAPVYGPPAPIFPPYFFFEFHNWHERRDWR